MNTREKDYAAAVTVGHSGHISPARDMAGAFADGCTHRDRQVVAFLRKYAADLPAGAHAQRADILACALQIERGEHVP